MGSGSIRDDTMMRKSRKERGAFYTPDEVVRTLLRWAVRSDHDRLLDPSCGDGRFIAGHRCSVGVEPDGEAARIAMERAPWALVHEGDFFTWAENTTERFDCAAGNPPFIRYQTFSGDVRARALGLCSQLGANFSGLTSSWAPFLVAAAGLLKPGGRIAFVVPAEIGHAPYAAPLLEYLTSHFSVIQVIAIKKKLFPDLSEDCWLLYAEDFGGTTNTIRFTPLEDFAPVDHPPDRFTEISKSEWRTHWQCRLRPFLMTSEARDLYHLAARSHKVRRLHDLALVGIGYVTGSNEFFHLRRSQVIRWGIPECFLRQAVRRGEVLPSGPLTATVVKMWEHSDEPILLLALPRDGELPSSVLKYLRTEEAKIARQAYKCRTRTPWYSVPDVHTPDFFLTYMSGIEPSLVRNDARCTGTNSVHMVRLRRPQNASILTKAWCEDIVRLSCEIEGHPLGGGMLKLEPREAGRILLPSQDMTRMLSGAVVADAVETLRSWRHVAAA